MNRGHAFTLVEVIIALSASSILMVLAIGLVHRSMAAGSLAKNRGDHQRTLLRLCGQFREDVHRAEDAEVVNAARLRLLLPEGGSIEYSIDDNRCQRDESMGEQRGRGEIYQLSSDSRMEFSQLSGPARMTLVVDRQAHRHRGSAVVDAHIVAVVGRRLLLASVQKQEP